MSVPDYQTLMLPVLQLTSDDKVHTGAETVDHVATIFNLTEEERATLLPSGRTRLLNNRTHWALTYLRHAGLIQNESRGKFRITQRGRLLLAEKPSRIDKALLTARFPEVVAFIGGAKAADALPAAPVQADQVLSPEEQLESSYLALRAELEAAMLERLRKGTWEFFERAVLELLVAMGYGGSRAEAAHHVGRSGDGGIDGVINEDKLGLDKIFVQAKRWEGVVGCPTVQGFAGSLDSEHARKGILITTSSFTADARTYVLGIEKRIVLMDGAELVGHMVDHGVGVQPRGTFTLQRLDEEFFDAVD